jgi:polar amino acid transport system permease protein
MNSFISVAGFEKAFRYVKLFKQGLVITVMLALFTVIIGFVLGIVLAVMRMTDFRPLRFLAYGKNGRRRRENVQCG